MYKDVHKWLKWKILCYMYFYHNKKMQNHATNYENILLVHKSNKNSYLEYIKNYSSIVGSKTT